MSGLRLGVNIDHIATLRQARYASMPESKNAEPDIVVAAAMCERAGAQGIVTHLRSDRRHIQDRDIDRLRQNIMTKLNLEMVELQTGKLANAFSEKIEKQELENLQAAAKAASELKLQVNAGHGINYTNIALIHKIPHLTELNIGHSIVSRAVFVGIEDAVKELLGAMADYRG